MNQTTPFEFAVRQGADAKSRFPTDSYEDKERRALKAALHVAELRNEFPLTAARVRLARLFSVSERQIRRAEKILLHHQCLARDRARRRRHAAPRPGVRIRGREAGIL